MKFTSHSSRSLLPFYTGGALKPKPSSHFLQYCLFIRLQLCGFLFLFWMVPRSIDDKGS